MIRQALYIVASFLENAATAIYDRIDMNPHAEPELYISRECLDEMSRIDRASSRGWPQTQQDMDMLCSMLGKQEAGY